MHFSVHIQQQAEAATQVEHPARRARRRTATTSKLLALPVALALAAPAAAPAAEPTTGYSQATPPTKTEPTTTGYKQTPTAPTKSETTPAKQEVAPKEEKAASKSTPSSEVGPSTGTRMSTSPHARAGTLPFTGLDLRWLIAGGVLLLGSGLSILVSQRMRQRQRS